jgi:hypothetical protein
MARVPGSPDRVAGAPSLDEETSRVVTTLRRDGLVEIGPVLPPDDVASLADFARRGPGRVRVADGSASHATWDDRPDGAASLALDGAFAWARPEVQRIMVDERLRAIVAAVTGLQPVFHPPQLYWTFPSPLGDEAVRTALARGYHWDYDGIAGLRLHVLLTDVDDGSGPMEYVTGSHRPGALGWHLPGSTDQRSDAVARFGPERHRRLVGPAGTTFLSDPNGLHRSTEPLARERLFLVLPIQGGGYGGYYRRIRALPVRDDAFGARLAAGDPSLRLFEAAAPEATAATLATP